MPGQVGNSGGKKGRSGRRPKAVELGLNALLNECVTEADRKELFKTLLKAGKAGDTRASALLLSYIYGKPTEKHEVGGLNGGPVVVKVVYESK